MELVTGLFIVGLYKATEKIWEKGFDAAWAPVDEGLKKRFTRWAGRDKERQRQAAFVRAAGVARTNTLRYAADPDAAGRILDALNGERDPEGAEALAGEAAKLMLFSATPDLPRLTELCQKRLHWDAIWGEGEPPAAETVAATLSGFLANLREALLDQEPYHDLIQREILRTLRQIAAPPVTYDDEATYRYQVAEMYRQLEFVGIPELKERRPITVEDIFVHLHAERELEQSEIPEELLTRRGDPEARHLKPETVVRERVDVDEALRRARRLVLLGDPGAGKTTLLKYLTVICAEGRAEVELGLKADDAGSPLPAFIPLREFAAECAGREQDYCLLDYLYTHAREHLLLHLPPAFFEKALEDGRCLVCLDGLDEVWAVGQRKAVTDEVRALATHYPRNRYVVTSRVVGYEEAPLGRRDFVHHTVLSLEDDDMREFVRKWYEARERDPVQRKHKADDLIATIEREPRIKSLAANPLLLTIIALVHRIEAELPHERVKLYDKCVTALVDTWEEVKGLTIEEKQRPFYRYRRRLLERLAYELHTQAEEPGRVQTVKVGDLELMLTRFLMENRRLGLAGDPDGARDEAQAFVRLARGRTGLLVERGEGTFGFPHLTFQEYLAACDVENRCIHRGVDAIWEEIEPHLYDPHWQEVILLLLGSLNKYDEPPTLLVERILATGKEDRFESVLHRHLYLAARVLADRVDIADDLHRRVVTAMLENTRTADWWERGDTLTTLLWLEQDDYAADGLLIMARDLQVSDLVRRDAASALGQLGRTEEAAEILLTMARDVQVSDLVRSVAASALGQLGRAEEQVLDGLLALARDPRVPDLVRRDAASALGQLGRTEEQVPDGLLTLACNPQVSDLVRSAAASALGQLGRAEETVLDGLLTLARDPQVSDWVRSAAASALGQLGRAEKQVLDGLLTLARDPQVSDWVRSVATSALSQLGRAEEQVPDGLLTLARDPQVDDWVRRDAASALGQLGRTEEAAEILLAMARDPQVSAGVHSDAASALGQLGRAEEAAEILISMARDPQVPDSVRRDAASALGQLGRAEEQVLDGLLALAHNPQVSDLVRRAAASALGQLGRTEEQVLDGLLILARDPQVSDWVRSVAASALGQLGRAEEQVLDGLLALARDPRVGDWVRRDAASALGQLGRAEEKVLDGLLALACNPQVSDLVRRAAASALGQLGRAEKTVLDGLLTLARDLQVSDWVRSAAASALGQLGRAEEQVLDGLLTLARDPQVSDWVRSAAYESLKRLVGGAGEQ